MPGPRAVPPLTAQQTGASASQPQTSDRQQASAGSQTVPNPPGVPPEASQKTASASVQVPSGMQQASNGPRGASAADKLAAAQTQHSTIRIPPHTKPPVASELSPFIVFFPFQPTIAIPSRRPTETERRIFQRLYRVTMKNFTPPANRFVAPAAKRTSRPCSNVLCASPPV